MRPAHTRARIQVAFWILTQSARYKTRVPVSASGFPSPTPAGRDGEVFPGKALIVCQHERANTNLPFTLFDVDPRTKRVTSVAIVPGGD